ncbi:MULTISPECIES: (R,R)-butanediol dehydrogenase [Paenibacillus]|uniref:(R,R)-butanediol dehydrogenase n=1 Tax=Paenibacillus TaxID=44249 RepID=UPI0002F77BE6|nr:MULTISPECIES: (R,R)-butanediol dehydrogenase [unclassified Paenibacillus]OXL87502.1 Zn-dependent alcohol dehydrogenase [Paenibacillus sp. SSG-1]BAV19059.1 2,5-diketo-3-deoxy-L-galactonate 5-reductase [Paenibacillus sp. SSG-1]
MKAAFYEGNKNIVVGAGSRKEPGPGEVEIKVAYAGICGTDLHIYHGHMDHRVTLPQVMGHEMSGVIERVGKEVTSYKPGDRVTVRPLGPCGECPACQDGCSHICHRLKFMGIETDGAFQSYWTVPASTLHMLPDDLSLQHGAMIEPLAVACHDVRLGKVAPGEYVVVIGGGPIGTLIALVARAAGARVVVAEINPYRLQLLSEMGFEICNSNEQDLAEYVQEATGGKGADVVFEVTSSLAGAEVMTKLPKVRGRIVIVGIFSKPVPVDLHRFFWREIQLLGARVYEHEDFEQAIQLAASGELQLERIISKIYPIEQIQEGFEQMESGSGVMKILIQCN